MCSRHGLTKSAAAASALTMHIILFQDNSARHVSKSATWSAASLSFALSVQMSHPLAGERGWQQKCIEWHQKPEKLHEALAAHLSS